MYGVSQMIDWNLDTSESEYDNKKKSETSIIFK